MSAAVTVVAIAGGAVLAIAAGLAVVVAGGFIVCRSWDTWTTEDMADAIRAQADDPDENEKDLAVLRARFCPDGE